MTQPLSPFDKLFAQLTQAMSPEGSSSTPVTNELGWQQDAQHTNSERVVWIPRHVSAEAQPFELPRRLTPWRTRADFDVSIYADSLERLLEEHGLLVAWLDLLLGPPQGCAPSEDDTPAVLRGTVDLMSLTYPYSGLVGKQLDLTSPLARALAFPGTLLATPRAIATAVNLASIALGLDVRARVVPFGGLSRYLELLLPTDPLGTDGAILTLDPAASGSACAILGFSFGDDNISATGTPPTAPYRPGYEVAKSIEPGMRGGMPNASGWGAIVPVTLFLPLTSLEYLTGVIADTPLQVIATGGSIQDEIVVDIP